MAGQKDGRIFWLLELLIEPKIKLYTSVFIRIPYQLVIIPEMSKILCQCTEEQLFDWLYNEIGIGFIMIQIIVLLSPVLFYPEICCHHLFAQILKRNLA